MNKLTKWYYLYRGRFFEILSILGFILAVLSFFSCEKEKSCVDTQVCVEVERINKVDFFFGTTYSNGISWTSSDSPYWFIPYEVEKDAPYIMNLIPGKTYYFSDFPDLKTKFFGPRGYGVQADAFRVRFRTAIFNDCHYECL